VLALPGGSVREIVCEGVSGHVCDSVEELAHRARELALPAAAVRQYAESDFSLDRMVRQYAELYEEVVAGVPAAQLAATVEESSEDEFPQQRAVA
jgi:glycosyltransferase involved in cell wall biosynthesis